MMKQIDLSKTVLGIELGSTRIKAVLLDEDYLPIASGSFTWENQLTRGVWTYALSDAETGLQTCFAALKADFEQKYAQKLTTVGTIGVSAMMHGYLPFDKDGNQLAAFRTWRNTMTGEAVEKLTELFGFNIPQRWSIAHLYQAMLNGEAHTTQIDYLATLAGYVHWRLTGKRVLGIGDCSGMFPIDSKALDYNAEMLQKFQTLTDIDLRTILPQVLPAGAEAGVLTETGAKLLDPSGDLQPGIPFCPPEGDAGTGMTATNSVRIKTGNVSAGTSDFAMIVVDKPLGVHREIDMVTTPDGAPVAMVHCNNCTSDINAWIGLFGEFASAIGAELDANTLYTLLFRKALEGDADCGGLLSYNYLSGEGVTDLDSGRPVFARTPDAKLTLANFMRTHLLSALATLKIGLDILTGEEHVAIEKLYGHGGFFKTPEVGQRLLSAAVGAPVSVMETAGEGGPYGMALLAAYRMNGHGKKLADFLDTEVFADAKSVTLQADAAECAGFDTFLARYKKALPLEKTATEVL
jgi:sugar (pentulose or hexulose) kinase